MKNKTASESGTIERRVLIQAAPEIVFRALTEGELLEEWFCDRAQADPREGGEIVATWWSGRKSIQGKARILRFTPGEFLELLWIDDGAGNPAGDPTHRLAFTIRKRRSTSEVVVSDQDPRIPDPESFARLIDGWNNMLFELKDCCERLVRAARPRRRKEESATPGPVSTNDDDASGA